MKNADKPITPLRAVDGKLISESDNEFIEGAKPLIGLTKREHFAGLAMQALLSNHGYCINQNYTTDNITHRATVMADSLLKQLEK